MFSSVFLCFTLQSYYYIAAPSLPPSLPIYLPTAPSLPSPTFPNRSPLGLSPLLAAAAAAAAVAAAASPSAAADADERRC